MGTMKKGYPRKRNRRKPRHTCHGNRLDVTVKRSLAQPQDGNTWIPKETSKVLSRWSRCVHGMRRASSKEHCLSGVIQMTASFHLRNFSHILWFLSTEPQRGRLDRPSLTALV